MLDEKEGRTQGPKRAKNDELDNNVDVECIRR